MKFVFILGLVAFVCGIPHKQEQPVAKQGYNYGEVLGLSIMFYEAQRTGRLPANNRIPYRGDSMLDDKGSDGEDLTGGYFDAGDHVKFGLPMSAFTTIVAWGLIDYEGGYSGSGNLDAGRDVVRWSAEYFIKAHPQQYKLYVQVGDGNADHAYWGRPEEWNGPRPSYFIDTSRPGSDIAAETAAALAASYLVFKDSDPSFASTCLAHARDLMAFADTYRAKYSDSVPEAAQFYNSWSGFGDELAWGAAWMYRATGEQKYLDDVRRFQSEYDQVNGRPAQFGWDDKTAGFQILMAKLTNEDQYKTKAAAFCDWVVDQAPKTPKGLVHLDQWGALRHASNVAFVCMQAGDAGINRDKYYDFARRQIGYILGDTGRSFVCGYGNNPPTKPHHRSSSCPNLPAPCDWNSGAENPGPNHQTLYGALVGGPDAQDNYVDDRNDYVKNEVATDYNAAFQSALAGLAQAQSKGML